MKERRCTKCKGLGEYIPPTGMTKADIVKCHICGGTGTLPDDYKIKKELPRANRARYFNKNDGIILLKALEDEV